MKNIGLSMPKITEDGYYAENCRIFGGDSVNLYNMLHGMTPATFFILPMLGKHPDEYPRFRDCFTNDDEHPEYKGHIHIYTRTGGGNREDYVKENNMMRAIPGFVVDFDDSFDSTYASWIFKVPEKWKGDFDKVISGDLKGLSDLYKAELYRIFPKMKQKFDRLFERIKKDIVVEER